MKGQLIRLPAPTSSATWRGLANDRHRQVVALRRRGLKARADALMRDVRTLDKLAHRARLREAAEFERRRRVAEAGP